MLLKHYQVSNLLLLDDYIPRRASVEQWVNMWVAEEQVTRSIVHVLCVEKPHNKLIE